VGRQSPDERLGRPRFLPGAVFRYMLVLSTKRLENQWRSSSVAEQGTHKPPGLSAVVSLVAHRP
jgi:hypothetical protein